MLQAIKSNKVLFRTAWFLRRMVGITPEKLNAKFHQQQAAKLIDSYLSRNTVRRLQIGAQSNSVDGWLNVDIEPKSRAVAFMDATRPFPLADHTFDFIFTEHMVEHITFPEACFMLKECYRVLKPGGVIRVSTPNLGFLIDLYQNPEDPLHRSYIEQSTQRYFTQPTPAMDTVVINNFFRDWGHRFIHDAKSLQYVLKQAGFSTITRCTVGESTHSALANLEQHDKEIGTDFNRLESIILEATKL